MNDNEENKNEPTENGATERPLGYWLRVIDALISREFATAFEAEEASRREWMLLNIVAGEFRGPLPANRHGKGLRRLEDRGWIVQADGVWALTDEGRAAKERLGLIVDGIRERVAGAVSPEDFATTMASLEAVARELGWDENEPMPRGRFGRRGFGPRGFGRGFGHGFGPGFRPGYGFRPGFGPDADAERPEGEREFGHRGFGPGFGPGRGFGPGFGHRHGFGPDDRACGHGHHEHGHRGHRKDRAAEGAYERGFTAGFEKGRTPAV